MFCTAEVCSCPYMHGTNWLRPHKTDAWLVHRYILMKSAITRPMNIAVPRSYQKPTFQKQGANPSKGRCTKRKQNAPSFCFLTLCSCFLKLTFWSFCTGDRVCPFDIYWSWVNKVRYVAMDWQNENLFDYFLHTSSNSRRKYFFSSIAAFPRYLLLGAQDPMPDLETDDCSFFLACSNCHRSPMQPEVWRSISEQGHLPPSTADQGQKTLEIPKGAIRGSQQAMWCIRWEHACLISFWMIQMNGWLTCSLRSAILAWANIWKIRWGSQMDSHRRWPNQRIKCCQASIWTMWGYHCYLAWLVGGKGPVADAPPGCGQIVTRFSNPWLNEN